MNGGRGAKKRSCSFLNKSQAANTATQPPINLKYKNKSKWETT